ncbi:MAG TPA: hypothetical protein PK264_19990 [Hyphomicrobiaceae bacterium]|nr:hypothetical protein [Hyphomicrobiaceae bacterium]
MPIAGYSSGLEMRSRSYDPQPKHPEAYWTLAVLLVLVVLSFIHPLLVTFLSLICVAVGLVWAGLALLLPRDSGASVQRRLVAPGIVLLIGFAAGVIGDVDYLMPAR